MRTEDTMELRWILKVIGRWAWLIVVCSLLALIVSSLVVTRTAPVYEATSTLAHRPGTTDDHE